MGPRRLQGALAELESSSIADQDAYLSTAVDDGRLVADLAASGLAGDFGFSTPEDMLTGLQFLPVTEVQPSISSSPLPFIPDPLPPPIASPAAQASASAPLAAEAAPASAPTATATIYSATFGGLAALALVALTTNFFLARRSGSSFWWCLPTRAKAGGESGGAPPSAPPPPPLQPQPPTTTRRRILAPSSPSSHGDRLANPMREAWLAVGEEEATATPTGGGLRNRRGGPAGTTPSQSRVKHDEPGGAEAASVAGKGPLGRAEARTPGRLPPQDAGTPGGRTPTRLLPASPFARPGYARSAIGSPVVVSIAAAGDAGAAADPLLDACYAVSPQDRDIDLSHYRSPGAEMGEEGEPVRAAAGSAGRVDAPVRSASGMPVPRTAAELLDSRLGLSPLQDSTLDLSHYLSPGTQLEGGEDPRVAAGTAALSGASVHAPRQAPSPAPRLSRSEGGALQAALPSPALALASGGAPGMGQRLAPQPALQLLSPPSEQVSIEGYDLSPPTQGLTLDAYASALSPAASRPGSRAASPTLQLPSLSSPAMAGTIDLDEYTTSPGAGGPS